VDHSVILGILDYEIRWRNVERKLIFMRGYYMLTPQGFWSDIIN
jgi:hypothetical protein